jgi:predicted TIM-barrel fold metal-dependent hydrolase
MLIVDAQIHLWAADTPDRPWPPGGAQRAHQPYAVGKDMALAAMNEAGVDRAIIVPPSWEGERNDLALDAVRDHPDRFAVMGRFPLEKLESRSLVDGWRRQPGMLGMRFTFNTEQQRPWLTDGTTDWLWPAAERAAIPLMMSVSGQLPAVDRIAERHPGLKLVVDHLGLRSGTRGEQAFAGLRELCKLARHANVAVKASALPCYSLEAYPFRDIQRHIRSVYDSFGPRRMFWGTDWTRLPCPWRQAVTLFTEELPWLSTADKEWIMGRGVCEWLGWPAPRAT